MPDVRGYAVAVAHLHTSLSAVRAMHGHLVSAVICLCAEHEGANPSRVLKAELGTAEYRARSLAMTILHVACSFTQREVAEILGQPRTTVKRHLDAVVDQRETDHELDAWIDGVTETFLPDEAA